MNAKFLAVAMMGLGLSAAGCSTASNEELAALDLVGYETQENPVGGGTSNHNWAPTWDEEKYRLNNAMNYALGTVICVPGWPCGTSHVLSSNIYNTGILDTPGGQEIFQTAVECALGNGEWVEQTQAAGTTSPKTFTGQGSMSTTAGWFSGPLTTVQKEDVMRCVIARVNALGQPVPIVLSGKNVANQRSSTDSTDLKPDALWDVKITKGTFYYYGQPITYTVIDEYVWPIAHVNEDSSSATCGSLDSALSKRICDEPDAGCGFDVRETATDDCTKVYKHRSATSPFVTSGPYYYICNATAGATKRPVVQSWATADALEIMYPECLDGVPLIMTRDPSYIPDEPYMP